MTAFKRFTALLLACLFVLAAVACTDEKAETSKEDTTVDTTVETTEETTEETSEDTMYEPLNFEEMKGIWLYQYRSECIFRTRGDQRDERDFRVRAERVVSNLARDGYNTLFLQVRPYGDSFYPSEFYCPTNFVVENYSDTFDYDPLAIFVELAHQYNISIHAWLNPMRLMTAEQIKTVPESYKIKQWYNEKEGDYVVRVGERYYLNPAYAETRQLIIDGALEICKNYDIDGIHFDDYFYVSIDNGSEDLRFDQKAYAASNPNPTNSLAERKEWRRQNVNTLLRDLYAAIKAHDERIMFGISPAGNINNNQTGYLCADVKTWCSTPGYIDYIAPQVYWSFNYKANFAKFNICTQDWAKLVTCDEVKLIVGMGLYRTKNPTYNETDPGWYLYKDNIKRMLEFLKAFKADSGWIMFDYETLYDINTGEYTASSLAERENFLPLLKG